MRKTYMELLNVLLKRDYNYLCMSSSETELITFINSLISLDK